MSRIEAEHFCHPLSGSIVSQREGNWIIRLGLVTEYKNGALLGSNWAFIRPLVRIVPRYLHVMPCHGHSPGGSRAIS
jgi:hypothetical protein